LDDIDQNFYFKNPFKTNEENEDIKILQKLLIKLSYYTGSINGIYDNATLSAVYSLQKENGLLK
jgi:peptidoglycan hydrolase-like protein with peptidoglycan-binding domain